MQNPINSQCFTTTRFSNQFLLNSTQQSCLHLTPSSSTIRTPQSKMQFAAFSLSPQCTSLCNSRSPTPQTCLRRFTHTASFQLRRSSFTHTTQLAAATRTNSCRSPHQPLRMALSKVVIAGGTGFIGRRLASAFQKTGASVTVLSRSSDAAKNDPPAGVHTQTWSPNEGVNADHAASGWQNALAGADAVINLCGYPVVSQWTDECKENIIASRIGTTQALVDAIAGLPPALQPKCLVGSSGVGYYGLDPPSSVHEYSKAADDFLAGVCKDWEVAAMKLKDRVGDARVVVVRIGVVLGDDGGAMRRMLPYFQNFVGGPIGSGEQYMSWIHVDDLVRIFMRAAETPGMSGPYNGTGPQPVTMGEFSSTLASVLKRPNLIRLPSAIIKAMYGEGASVVLQGQSVIPKRLLDEGFEFLYPTARHAITAVVNKS